MEALAALSVASSVVAFVDFGSKLLSNSRQIYKSPHGFLSPIVDIEVITRDLQNLTEGLRRKLPENRPLIWKAHRESSEDDEALDRLCIRCHEMAQTLTGRIRKLQGNTKGATSGLCSVSEEVQGMKVERELGDQGLQDGNDGLVNGGSKDTNKELLSTEGAVGAWRRTRIRRALNWGRDGSVKDERIPGAQYNRWESFRKALVVSWNKGEIEEMATTLKDFRSEIEFRILVSFRGALNDMSLQQSQTSAQISRSTQMILDTFLNERDSLAQQLHIQSAKIIEIQEMQAKREVHDLAHEENYRLGAIELSGSLEAPKDRRTSGRIPSEDPARDCHLLDELRLLIIENGILNSLSFTSLADRQESIELPHTQTFDWIFEEPGNSQRSWSNFVEWLRSGNGIYWINGKVGSGKSTLMRYVYENDLTKRNIDQWAGDMQSQVSGFFFWRSGDDEQRSQRGLLRSLLFNILQSHRDLIPEVLPEAWASWSTRATAIVSGIMPPDSLALPSMPKTPTMAELKRAFRTLLRSVQRRVKLCFFIDGLDEYEGDYLDIIELFQECAKSPAIKLCLSSRPILAFEQAFAELPYMRLQDLTRADIEYYVQARLHSHKYMNQLSRTHATETSQLIHDIVNKSSGVFLWVKLVVRSLLLGLCDYNRISDLKRRVEYLPQDLEELYAHMLKHTDPFYHEQAAQLFQIFRASQRSSPEMITLLNLSWADDENENWAENAPIQPLTKEEVALRCKVMDARLKSVCAGLLESNDNKFSSIFPDSKVMFLHRTVSDWMAKADVWADIVSRTAGTGFSSNLSMLKSRVLSLKSLALDPGTTLEMDVVSDALLYAQKAERELGYAFPKLLDQLDIAASVQWRKGSTHIKATHTLQSTCSEADADHYSYDSVAYITPAIELARSSTDVFFSCKESRLEPLVSCLVRSSSSNSVEYGDPETQGAGPSFIRNHNCYEAPAAFEDNSNHWSCGIEILGIKPFGEATTFYNLTNDLGLFHYTNMKYETGLVVDQDVNHHLLMQAVSPSYNESRGKLKAPDPDLIEKILDGGTDPNISFDGTTPWEGVLISTASVFAFPEHNLEWEQEARDWARIFEIFLENGADPRKQSGRHPRLPGRPRISPSLIVERYMPMLLATKALELRMVLIKKGVQGELEINKLDNVSSPFDRRRIEKATGPSDRTAGMQVSSESTSFSTWIRWFLRR